MSQNMFDQNKNTLGKEISVRIGSIGSNVKRAEVSRQTEYENEFNQAAGGKAWVSPPYEPSVLANIFEKSNILRQCIDAYKTNIAMYGWEIIAASPDTEKDPNEVLELQSFIDRANSDESLTTVHSRLVENYEKYGFAFLEIIRDKLGRVSIFRNVRSFTMRLRPRTQDKIAVTYDVARGKRITNVTELKAFRCFLQIINGRITYFKEFGDPRRMDFTNGEYQSVEFSVPDDKLATEIVHFKQDSEDPYGVPRWISQLPSILGSREAEEGNLRYFEDNTVPPAIMSVTGGRLTKESFQNLRNALQKHGIGKDRQHQIMLIEAIPDREGLDDKGSVGIRLDKLTDARQTDGLFKEFDDANQAKVMSSFRLGPILIGKSDDHTYATANTAQFIAETQVFAPARTMFDEIYNNRLVSSPTGLNLKTVYLRSKAPTITNPETLIKSLTALNVMGAVTPRSAILIANKILQIELPNYPAEGEEEYEPWTDKPIVLETAGIKKQSDQAVKSPADKAIEDTGVLDVAPMHGNE